MADITGLEQLNAAILDLRRQTARGIRRALVEIGDHAMREAKANAPISPTMKRTSSTLKRKKRTASRKMPGGLEKSIFREILPGDSGVSVFVPQNGLCQSKKGFNYAKRIHDEKGSKWRKRGPGTVAKGARADAKFVERAIKDNVDKYTAFIEKEIRKVSL